MANSTLEGERFTISSVVIPEEFWDSYDPTTYYTDDAGAGDPGMEIEAVSGHTRYPSFGMAAFPLFQQDSATESQLPGSSDPPFPPVYPYFFSTDLIYGREKMNNVLRITRGDSYLFDVTVQLDNAAYNLGGVTLTMTAKWDAADLDDAAIFQKTIGDGITVTDSAAGIFQVELAPSDTSSLPASELKLKYDIQMVDGTKVYTVASGDLVVRPDVTIGA